MYRTLSKQASGNNHSLIYVDLNSSVPATWVVRGVDVLRLLDRFKDGGRLSAGAFLTMKSHDIGCLVLYSVTRFLISRTSLMEVLMMVNNGTPQWSPHTDTSFGGPQTSQIIGRQ